MKEDDAGSAIEALEDDIAAILGDGRAHPGINELLDLGDNLRVSPVAIVGVVPLFGAAFEQRQAMGEMFHDRAKNGRLDVLPVAVALGHGNEIGAEEDARN